MDDIEAKYKPIPFWSWNDLLEGKTLKKQISWMNQNGIGGFFMHARGGLLTSYLSEDWFKAIKTSLEEAKKLNMEAYAYDENGWPSGFAGGELLKEEKYLDRYLSYSISSFDDKAFVSYSLSENKLKIAKEGEKVLNVYVKVSTSTVDICNSKVVKEFIKLTHEKYKENDNGSLRGFFTDEPQYYRWGVAFSPCLIDYFKEKYDEDIKENLGLLFVEKEGYERFRYRYWKGMQELMLSSYGEQIYTWCDNNSYNLTGHYVEETSLSGQMDCCAGIMPFYEFMHIPGVDHLGRWCPDILPAKQVGSVASQLGKKQVLAEAFAGSGWDVTPIELKRNIEALYVGGVNLLCHHLLPYSEYGQRKRDYPAHFGPINEWVIHGFREFNDYLAALGYFLSNSEEKPQIAILSPIRSAYLFYKKDSTDGYEGLKDIEFPFHELLNTISNRHLSYHLVDENILSRHGAIKGNKLICGERAYSILILPKLLTIDKNTKNLIDNFLLKGGKLSLPYGLPSYLEGEKYDFSYWKENLPLTDIRNIDGFECNDSNEYRLAKRFDNKGKEFIYIVNVTDHEVHVSFHKKGFTSFLSYNPKNKKYTAIPLYFSLKKGESKILYWGKEKIKPKNKLKPLSLNKSFVIESFKDNFLALDNLQYSFDNKNFSLPTYHLDVLKTLLEKRYQGDLYLKYSFFVKQKVGPIKLVVEDSNLINVFINNKKITGSWKSKREHTFAICDLKNDYKIGKNEIVLKLNYYQSEDVYYALFGENIQESLKNCLVYKTNIEPIYIKGHFGVYGNFTSKNEVVYGEKFYIAKPKKVISSLIEEGFPFFHGDIVLSQKIKTQNTSKQLTFDKNFSCIKLMVNGHKLNHSVFSYEFNLSKYLKNGNNNISIQLTVSPRNTLGPHHNMDANAEFISPSSFGEVVDPNTYSFLKTIL